ncbi:unnamed protein product [Microthlaspi erraticum]|uniref:Uncharacterized protein n=1 Tax=Microthlaspi erraticum TaxID=1685480 RepID=A0A6D2JM44_9BRAS|nr:unnamed protein product [Microthlaspi erraticum]
MSSQAAQHTIPSHSICISPIPPHHTCIPSLPSFHCIHHSSSNTNQTAISRISAERAVRLAEERCSALGQNRIRPTEVSAKVQPPADHAHDPGNIVPRSAKPTSRHAAHDQRASREQASRPRNPFAYHGRCIRPSRERTSHVRPRNHRPNLLRPTSRPTVKSSGPTVPTRPRPDCPADRPARPSERRGRPEAVFEAQSAQFKPKAGADLARLGLAVFFILRAL